MEQSGCYGVRPQTIAQRYFGGGYGCLVVWRLARAEGPQAESARKLLVRLSGRLISRNFVTAGTQRKHHSTRK